MISGFFEDQHFFSRCSLLFRATNMQSGQVTFCFKLCKLMCVSVNHNTPSQSTLQRGSLRTVEPTSQQSVTKYKDAIRAAHNTIQKAQNNNNNKKLDYAEKCMRSQFSSRGLQCWTVIFFFFFLLRSLSATMTKQKCLCQEPQQIAVFL